VTAICGGGTSGPQTGASAVVLVGSGVIATMLEKSGNLWLAFAAALLTLPELVLSTFCATDPPAMPTFTSAESAALLNVTFGTDFSSGLSKFSDLVRNLAWQQYCMCTSGALVVPAPVAPPSGTPIYQAPSAPTGQPCFTLARTVTALQIAAGNSIAFGGGSNSTAIPNVTAIRITATGTPSAGTGHQYQFNLFGSTDGGVGTAIGSSQIFPLSGTSYYLVNNPNPNNRFFYANLVAAGTGTGTTDILPIIFDLFCGGALPGAQQPCCPPDTATQSTLDLILKMATLIQRQIAPFSYIAGASHTGISGNGTITVFGLIGLKIDITTAPARLGQEAGDPISLWDAGWVNVGTADGFGPRQFITSDPMLLFPLSSAATVIGYSIPADVTVTITELVRES
jgi:hypothetical protein